MSATIREIARYACDREDCPRTATVVLSAGESGSWPSGYDWVRENLPTGWAVVDVNPVGQVGNRRWIVCSSDCVADLLDLATAGNITQCMQEK